MKRTLFFIFFVLYCIFTNADEYDNYFVDATSIQLEKAGTLNKVLGKTTDISRLQISGDLNDKDMKTLSKLIELQRLDLRQANIEKTRIFPVLPNLEVLFLPANQCFPVEYLSQIPANKNLRILMLCSFRYYSLTGGDSFGGNKTYNDLTFAPFSSLKKVVISNTAEMRQVDNNEYGILSKAPIEVDTLIFLDSKFHTDVFKARYYEGRAGHFFYVSTEEVDFTKIDAVQSPSERLVYEYQEHYRKTGKKLKIIPNIQQILDLQNMTYIGKGYFVYSNVENITFSASSLLLEQGAFDNMPSLKSITFAESLGNIVIPSFAFSNCHNLETIIFNCPVTIEPYAFSETDNIKRLIFNSTINIKTEAFHKEQPRHGSQITSIQEIIINASSILSERAFPIVERVTFNTMPAALSPEFAQCKNISIPAEDGAVDKFIASGLPIEHLIDPSANLDLDIVVTEPGKILNYIPFDKLTKIKSLTITGHLYDTDIKIIKQCVNLQYLNLANTYISESPSTQEHRLAENEMWAAMAEVLIVDAEAKQASGEYKAKEAKQKMTEAIYAAAQMQSLNPDMPDCHIPQSAFTNMLRLSEVILPVTVKHIGGRAFYDCKSLKKVDLGSSLEVIDGTAFAGTHLLEVSCPATLKEIRSDAFDNIESLTTLDLSRCTMTLVESTIGGREINCKIGCCPNLSTFYMPKGMKFLNFFVREKGNCFGIKDLYVGEDVTTINVELKNVKLHFQTELAPEFGWFGKVSNCVICVPKSANITSYFAKFNGNGNKIIQE